MKYLFVILLPIFLAGCIVDYRPNSDEEFRGLFLSDLIWTSDGNHILVSSDSVTTNNSTFYAIRDYDKSGTLIHPYDFSSNYYPPQLWPSSDDSTFFFSSSYSGNYAVYRYYIGSGTTTPIAGGLIYAESGDDRHLFIGPNSNQYYTNDNFLIVDAGGSKPRLEKSWFDPTPQYSDGVWIGSNRVGYFRYNSFNLVDFVIADTTGVKLDSFDVSGLSDFYSIQVFHGPGALYFSGYNGIMKYDSAAKTTSYLNQDEIYAADISPDGSFMVYERGGSSASLVAINTKTGVTKELATDLEDHPKISPAGNEVAFIDKSNSSGGTLKVLSVSAP